MKTGLRIVVADDEPDIRQYFQKILPRLGHKVIAAGKNGTELVELCREHKPDLVISDIKMPEMDGIEAAEIIYQEVQAPVILVSAHNDAETIERAVSDHVMCYLVKPIKQADLLPAMALAVKRFQQYQEMKPES